jgi:hypothetical protein
MVVRKGSDDAEVLAIAMGRHDAATVNGSFSKHHHINLSGYTGFRRSVLWAKTRLQQLLLATTVDVKEACQGVL